MRLKSRVPNEGYHFDRSDFIARKEDRLYFIDTRKPIKKGQVYEGESKLCVALDCFSIAAHCLTPSDVESIPVCNELNSFGIYRIETIAELVSSGKILPEAMSLIMEMML